MIELRTNDPLWDPDYQGCKMSGLPYDQCGCKHHARVEYEDEAGSEGDTSSRPTSVGECRTCGDPLLAGETYAGVYCSWLCSVGTTHGLGEWLDEGHTLGIRLA